MSEAPFKIQEKNLIIFIFNYSLHREHLHCPTVIPFRGSLREARYRFCKDGDCNTKCSTCSSDCCSLFKIWFWTWVLTSGSHSWVTHRQSQTVSSHKSKTRFCLRLYVAMWSWGLKFFLSKYLLQCPHTDCTVHRCLNFLIRSAVLPSSTYLFTAGVEVVYFHLITLTHHSR
jgi:hypothetical protein